MEPPARLVAVVAVVAVVALVAFVALVAVPTVILLRLVAPVPPEATGKGVVSVVDPATLRFPVFVSPGVVIPVVPSMITGMIYSNILVAVA